MPQVFSGETSILPELSVRRGRAAVEFHKAAVGEEHDWRLGRIADPFGHYWEIGTPLGSWPPRDAST